eukprot:5139538-Amphidinium_carterae.2
MGRTNAGHCGVAGPLTYKGAWLKNRCLGDVRGFCLDSVLAKLRAECDDAVAKSLLLRLCCQALR